MLTSAFGTDFGLANYPAFQKSADFRLLSIAPSGWYFNYADCGDKNGEGGDIVLAWFASKTGNPNYFEKDNSCSHRNLWKTFKILRGRFGMVIPIPA